MSPWLEKFNLGPALGLSLHAIQGDQAASDSNGKCHFRGCWILVNERHPLAPEVRRVWLTPGTRHATVREQGRALGYPGVLTGANDCCRVYYMAIDKVTKPTRFVSRWRPLLRPGSAPFAGSDAHQPHSSSPLPFPRIRIPLVPAYFAGLL